MRAPPLARILPGPIADCEVGNEGSPVPRPPVKASTSIPGIAHGQRLWQTPGRAAPLWFGDQFGWQLQSGLIAPPHNRFAAEFRGFYPTHSAACTPPRFLHDRRRRIPAARKQSLASPVITPARRLTHPGRAQIFVDSTSFIDLAEFHAYWSG